MSDDDIKLVDGSIPARKFEGQLWIQADVAIELRSNDRAAIDRLKAERDAAVERAEALDDKLAIVSESREAQYSRITSEIRKRRQAERGAARWEELCLQVDFNVLPYAVLDDALAMGSGALELHIDEAILKRTEQTNG